MKNTIGGIAIIGLTVLAVPAAAAQFNVSLTGALVSQGNEYYPGANTGIDANLSVGSVFTLTASFDSSLLLPYGNSGEFIAGLYGAPTTGPTFFRIDAPGMTWQSRDSLSDGWLNSYPSIIIYGDKVVGLKGYLSPAGSSARPELDFGGDASDWFGIRAPKGLYHNYYNTPGFGGVWDFANSSVTDPPSPDISAVPEPATWAMFLIGFGAIGFVMRRRVPPFVCG